jgi:phosphatidylserine synthase
MAGVDSPSAARRPILGHLWDAANLLTLAGLFSTTVAITLALNGKFAATAIALVFAFLFDVVDGRVARRISGRTANDRAFGANLDSLADVVSAGCALGIVLLAYGEFDAAFLPGAFVLLAAATLRLAYFNVHGLDQASASYTGLPTDLAILSFVAVMLLDEPLTRDAFQVVLYGAALVLSGLMVSALRIPKFTGIWYYATLVLALLLASAHTVRIIA